MGRAAAMSGVRTTRTRCGHLRNRVGGMARDVPEVRGAGRGCLVTAMGEWGHGSVQGAVKGALLAVHEGSGFGFTRTLAASNGKAVVT